MSFTKRDYESIANIISVVRERYLATHGNAAAREIQGCLSAYFAENNPRFDAERFARACEPGGGNGR